MDVINRLNINSLNSGACYFCLAKANGFLCPDCERDIIKPTNRCPVCARIQPGNLSCGACIKNPPMYSSTEVLFNYQYPAKNIIKVFKFNKRSEMAKTLAHKLVTKIENNKVTLPEVLIPVPLHKSRQRNRGYNQSLEIAKHISKKLKLRLDINSCKRVINTDPQSSLPMKTRKKNVKNAFTLNLLNTPSHVAIIDDVITTGSTINEISKLFKQNGCQRIDVWAIART